MGVGDFAFRRRDKMDSVIKGLLEQCPLPHFPRIFRLEPPKSILPR